MRELHKLRAFSPVAAATLIAFVVSVLAPSAALAAPAPVETAAASTEPGLEVDHTYTLTPDAEFANPERGFNKVLNKFIDVQKFELKAAIDNGFSFVHAGVDLSPYVTSEIDDGFIDQLRTSFALLREEGLKAFMHFSYSQNLDPATPGLVTSCPDVYTVPAGVPTDADATFAWMQKHLQKLKSVLAENADVIMALDAGMVGEWGEWHCSPNLLLTPDGKKEVLQAILDAFPADRQVALRHPYDILDPALVPDPFSGDSRITNYQSCYASRYPDDDGTWVTGPDGGTPTNEQVIYYKTQISQLGKNHMIGGVACHPSVRTSCAVAVTGPDAQQAASPAEPGLYDSAPELAFMHFTYLDGYFNPDSLAQYEPCRHEMTLKLGYRLELRHATLPGELNPGEQAHVSITLGNVGWASIINKRPAFLVLKSADTTHQIALNVDPRSWQSGQEVTIDQVIDVPADLQPGHYTLALWLPDQYESLRGNAAYSVRFANDGVWDAKAGYNVLAELNVPLPSLPATGANGATALLASAGAVLVTLGLGVVLLTARRRRHHSRSA